MINIQRCKPDALDIYQMAPAAAVWDISHMPAKPEKREEAVRRAQAMYERLMRLPRKPADLSNNDWAKAAGVNTSFFTNLKNGSEPSIGNLRAVLEAIGITIPEFFAGEARGRVAPVPSEQELERAILEALPGMPRPPEKRAQYLAEVVQRVLLLPEDQIASPANSDEQEEVVPEEGAPSRVATK